MRFSIEIVLRHCSSVHSYYVVNLERQIDCRQSVNCFHKHQSSSNNICLHSLGLKRLFSLTAWFMIQQVGFKLLLNSSLIYQDLLMSPMNEVIFFFLCIEESRVCGHVIIIRIWMKMRSKLTFPDYSPLCCTVSAKFHWSIQILVVVLSSKNYTGTTLLFWFCSAYIYIYI